MKTISVSEANQQFSRLVREMEVSGEGYIIQRRGKTIARLIPASDDKMKDPEWRAAYERLGAEATDTRRRMFRQAKIDCIEVTTGESFVDPLIKFFRQREARR